MDNKGICIKVYLLVVWFLRKLTGLCFHSLHTLNFWDPRRRLQELKTREASVVRSRIIARWKKIFHHFCSPDDFLMICEQELMPLHVLLDPQTSLYCVTADMAVFVKTCSSISVYRSKTRPFFYLSQFFNAQEVLITTVDWFERFAAEISGDCRVDVTWLFNTGRCGSTLVSQILETVPNTLCICQPEAMFNIATLARTGRISSEQKLTLLKSVISVVLYGSQTQNDLFGRSVERVVIKLRSKCVSLIKDIHRLFPKALPLFMYRSLPETLRSFRHLASVHEIAFAWMTDSDLVAAVTTYFRMTVFTEDVYEGECEGMRVIDLVHSLSLVGLLAAQFCSQIKLIQRLQAEGLLIPSIMYEDVVRNPSKAIGDIFDTIQISQDHVPSALTAMTKRSQSGVPGMDIKTPPASRRPLSPREQRDIETVLARYQLTVMDGGFQIRQRIGHV